LLVGDSDFFDYFECPHNGGEDSRILGMHTISTGDGILGETAYAKSHVVAVNLDNELFLNLLKENRENMIDPESDRDDNNLMYDWLNTVSHELQHAKEFIVHGGGLTPHEVDNAYECADFDYNVFDVSTGYNIHEDFNEGYDLNNSSAIIQRMEDRVESNGFETLSKCDLSKTNFGDAIEYFNNKLKIKKRTRSLSR
jgi:hypothetical protein